MSPREPVEPVLITPTAQLKRSFLEALPHYQQEELYRALDLKELTAKFDSYLDQLSEDSRETSFRPAHRVPASTFWYCAGEDYLGRVIIRHRLTPQLRLFGGHIGYDISPLARGKGHATRMLALALPLARTLGIESALITCDAHNVASRKVIEANGGVLAEQSEAILRFWVPTLLSGVLKGAFSASDALKAPFTA